MLWIAYISYLCFIDNSSAHKVKREHCVVNCLHFVSLLYWQQYYTYFLLVHNSCELLTFRIFALLTTVLGIWRVIVILLWIAYISYLCFIDNSYYIFKKLNKFVVNCLHFVSLLYWQQSQGVFFGSSGCCELLTFRIFALLTTVQLSKKFAISSCELLTFRIFALLTTV